MHWGIAQLTGMTVTRGGSILTHLPVLFWRILGALVLGVMLARYSWILFAPQATPMPAAAQHGYVAEAGRLFGLAVSGIALAEGVALPNVRLVGVFAASAGKPGFAVLKLDDKHQVGVALGESVAPGTKLLAVHADYVLLERAGVQQKVNLEGKITGAASGVTVAERAGGMKHPPKWQ